MSLGDGLVLDGFAPFSLPEWLTASWREPAPFYCELARWYDATGPAPLKSAPFRRYDLFHDLVLRNLALPTPAFVWYDANRTRRQLSYRELAVLAARRGERWRGAAAAGQTVALLRPFGPDLVISLLAAVRLGLVVALVPPSGRRLARARLAALGPALVDVDDHYAGLVPADAPRLPREDRSRSGVELEPKLEVDRSHAYLPGQPVALSFDAAAAAPTEPRPLSCDAAYLGALRDGAITLDLRRGDALAAPALPLLETQPALTFSALLSGATFVHLTIEQLERAPELLAAGPLKTVGVSAPLCELVRRHRLRLGEAWASWFRDPIAAPLVDPWHDFIAAGGLAATPAANLRWEAALGGCALFSPRRRGRPHVELLPAAGVPWSLVDLAYDDVPASTGAGRLAITPPGHAAPTVTASVLLPDARGWLSGGAMPTHPGGRTYPAADARAAVATVPACIASVVVLDPAGPLGAPNVTMLCFYDDRIRDGATVLEAVRQTLADELGPELLPDRVECFPLFPRRDDAGATDTRWCHDQLRSGGLLRKSRDELFLLLSRLRRQVVSHAKEPLS